MIRKLLKPIITFVLVLIFLKLKAQEGFTYKVSEIDSTLLKNANAVIRLENVNVKIESINLVTVTTKRAVTVLNKYGDRNASSYEPYDPETKIKKAHAVIYDVNGDQIKEYKKKGFQDRSATDGFSLIGDGRYIYFDYVPVSYPYTLVYESVVESENTAFLNTWFPITGYHLSIEKSIFNIVNPNKLEIRSFEKRFDKFPIEYNKGDQERSYVLSNLPALKKEINSPAFSEMAPLAKIALNNFTLIDVQGTATDWGDFGKWQHDNLILGRNLLLEETIKEVNELVENATSNREKAKLIYEYVQAKTRYISVQLGIGGWMPMKAADVDRLGYGDCKALTNYTQSLLASQNIDSYYTIVYAGAKRDINVDFASMQGNHAILNIPGGKEDIWLECTSQTLPFNYIGDFTDDRDVLVIKPEGGVIKRTKKYTAEENLLETNAIVNLNAGKSMKASVKRTSIGLQYNWNYSIQYSDRSDQLEKYQEYWGYINDLKIQKHQFIDDKDSAKFTENIEVTCSNYLKKLGARLMLVPNIFNRGIKVLPVYKNRKTPLVIERGYVHLDQYIINLPLGYLINNLPENKYIENQFGKYSYELEKVDETKIKFRRFLKITDGEYPKDSYEEYRKFIEIIKKIDQSKILLNLL